MLGDLPMMHKIEISIPTHEKYVSILQSLLTAWKRLVHVYVDDVYSIFFDILGEHLCHVQPNRDLKIKVLRCHKTKISEREMF